MVLFPPFQDFRGKVKMKRLAISLLAVFFCVHLAAAQKVPVQEITLDNGMRVLLVPRKGDPNIAAGWVAHVGSINEHPGITGLSHLFEHMMFKGTHVVGTKDINANLKVIDEMDRVRAEIQREDHALIRRQQLGEIPNARDPKYRSVKYTELLKQFDDLTKQERELMVKDEFDKIYTNAGGSGMNAGTSNDFTVFFINVPANKLELWFWMESDRLLNPVFREFYAERDVVKEERRLRTDSTPTGRFDEEFNSMFWQSSPYAWPVVGWPTDLDAITREEAKAYFGVHYAPNNLTACLVGDFDPANATALAKKYFGRIPRGPRDPEPIRTLEEKQLAEKRMVAYADISPTVRVRYHTVADGNNDGFALDVLSDILSGRTGRLYKALVLDTDKQKGIANSASANQNGQKYEGYFELTGVAKQGHRPEDVEQALYREIERLQKEPVSNEELQKVKNQNAAADFRRLQSSFGLMVQLLLRDNYRSWETINTDPARLQAVTADDIRRVANKYFSPENRTVAIYYTKSSGADNDPLLEGLNDQQKSMVRQFKTRIGAMNAEKLKESMAQLDQQGGAAPAEMQPVLKVVRKMMEDRLKQLEGGKQ
jgi:predicted Zn-dependent peptidase